MAHGICKILWLRWVLRELKRLTDSLASFSSKERVDASFSKASAYLFSFLETCSMVISQNYLNRLVG